MTEPRHVAQPRPGYYALRLVKDGPFVAAMITHAPTLDPETGEPMDRSPLWSAFIDGELVEEPSPDWVAAGVGRIWHAGERVSQEDYDYRLALAAWAREHAPNSPEANPFKPVDYNLMDPVFGDGPAGDATPVELGYPDPPDLAPVLERLIYTYQDLKRRHDALRDAYAKVPETIEKVADGRRVIDFEKQLRAHRSLVATRWQIEQDVYRNALKVIDRFFREFDGPTDVMVRDLQKRLVAYHEARPGAKPLSGEYGRRAVTNDQRSNA